MVQKSRTEFHCPLHPERWSWVLARAAFGFGESDACCACAGEGGACCAGALTAGPAEGAAAIVVAGTSLLFPGALIAASRSDSLDASNVFESALGSVSAPCHSGLVKIVTNATKAANETTFVIRPISVIVESPHRRGGGSRVASGHDMNSDFVGRPDLCLSKREPLVTKRHRVAVQ